jgi:hypothetical protein
MSCTSVFFGIWNFPSAVIKVRLALWNFPWAKLIFTCITLKIPDHEKLFYAAHGNLHEHNLKQNAGIRNFQVTFLCLNETPGIVYSHKFERLQRFS